MDHLKDFNPSGGMSANQIVLLFERATGNDLEYNRKLLAIKMVEEHLDFVPEATIRTCLTALLRIEMLRDFTVPCFKVLLLEDKSELLEEESNLLDQWLT